MSNDGSSSLEDITEKIDQGINQIENLIPEDSIARATGAKVGTEEHLHQGALLDKVKETNSTKRVNRILVVLKWVGYVGLLVASVVKFTGIVYDIDFHVPFLKEVISPVGVATLGFFITIIILIMTHLTSDGIVNNKWKALPRFTLIWLAVLGLSASFYFDYRAISNYTDVVVSKIKEEKISNSNDTDGVIMESVEGVSSMLNTNLALYQSSISSNQKRLEQISENRNVISLSIDKIKELKLKTKSNKEIRKLNQNIYTSRKQLEELTEEEARISLKNEKLMKQSAEVSTQIQKQNDKKGNLLKEVDDKMSHDQFNRLVFLFVLVIFIEVTSFAGLLSDFLGNKNLEPDLLQEIDSLRNNTDAMGVLRSHISQTKVRQAREFDRELTIQGVISEVHALSAIASMHRQAESIKGFTQATHTIGEATQDVTELAVEGIASTIRANLATTKARKLQDLLLENKEHNGEATTPSDI